MSMLDAHIPQLVASQSAFGAKAGSMRSTIVTQEATAQAFHAGDSVAAFQAAHAGAEPRSTACWISLRPTSAMLRAPMWPPMPLPRAATPASDLTDTA